MPHNPPWIALISLIDVDRLTSAAWIKFDHAIAQAIYGNPGGIFRMARVMINQENAAA